MATEVSLSEVVMKMGHNKSNAEYTVTSPRAIHANDRLDYIYDRCGKDLGVFTDNQLHCRHHITQAISWKNRILGVIRPSSNSSIRKFYAISTRNL